MTAEVAIINANAVAIAADSAVTIGNGKKIYNSALKVFSLSKIASVGIMIYGNAGLLGVPWETLIKIYREELKLKTFGSLEEYSQDFLKFLSKRKKYFPKEVTDSWMYSNILGYYSMIREKYLEEMDELFQENGEVTDKEALDKLQDSINTYHKILSNQKYSTGFNKTTEVNLRKKIVKFSKKGKDEIFANLTIPSPLVSKLYDISAFLHCRNVFSEARSGVVFTGFGEDEIYPAVRTYEIEGVIGSKLKYKCISKKCVAIEKPSECSIIPFAQDDMVYSFMAGMNPSVSEFVTNYLDQLITRFPELISDSELKGNKKDKAAFRKRIGVSVQKLIEEFFGELDNHKRTEHIDRILSMVNILPKDELAAMAESLVNLTAFKRRMTEQAETVGGPIDVAVISKGDGLVWVKRKHYFPPELNQHFFSNYYRGIND